MQKQNDGALDRANRIIKRQSQLESNRSTFEQQWQEIDEQIGTSPSYWHNNINTPGKKTTDKVFDTTAAQANQRFVAALSSTLTPRSQKWHGLKAPVPQLDEDKEVNVYLDSVTNILFAVRYDPAANFESQINECYSSLGKYGTACMFIDDEVGKGIRYKSIPLSQIYIAENSAGIVDTVFRKFRYTAYQAVDAWGKDKVSEKILLALDKNPEQEFDFIHAVYPNEDYLPGKAGRFKFYSCYIERETRHVISEGGYRTMPYAVSRYITEPNEIYGRSPAMLVLPEIKTLNRARKAVLQGAEKIVNPPLLAHDDLLADGLNTQPGGINYGAIGEDGRLLIQPLQTGARVDIGVDQINQMRQAINDAFLVTLFQILVEDRTMTATEVEYRQQEKGQMLAPTMGRQQAELLAPMIERELDILSMYGILPPMPEVILQFGGAIEIKYDAPLNKIMRSPEAIAILNTLQTAAGIAQFDPSVLQMFDIEEAMRTIAEIRGVPAKIIKSTEEIAAMKAAQAQQQQLQQVLQAAPIAAQTAKDFAQAQQAATSAGPAANLGVG